MNKDTVNHKLRSILRDNTAFCPLRGTMGGDLCHKRLHAVSYSNRIFERGVKDNRRSYCFRILVDLSGSMLPGSGANPNNERRLVEALRASKALVTMLSPFGAVDVCGFNKGFTAIKDIDALIVGVDGDRSHFKEGLGAINSLVGFHDSAAGNHDGFWLSKSVDDVLKVRASERIIIVLSDGQPHCDDAVCSQKGCTYNNEPARVALRRAVGYAKRKAVKVAAIGLMTSYVKEFYPTAEVINTLDTLPETVVKLLNKLVNRRG